MMKMKTRSYILSVIAAIMLLGYTGCQFRDEPNDKLSEESIWKSPLLLDEYVLPWYRNMDNGFSVFVTTIMKGIGREYEPWFGDQLTVSRSDWYQADYGDILKSSMEGNSRRAKTVWTKYYTQIQSVNKLLDNAGKIAEGDQKTRLLGEAHFFRAYYYYLLLRSFGAPLIIEHNYDPLNDGTKFPRATYEETVKFIVREADLARDLLKPVEEMETGRANRGAAIMLKAKTYLWASGVKFQNQTKSFLGFSDDRSAAMLEAAKKAYDELEALHHYDLVPIAGTTRNEIVSEYRNIFLTKNSIESIWEVQHSDDGDFSKGFGHKLDRESAAPSFGGTYAAYVPTHNHVCEYRTITGKRIDDPDTDYDAEHPYDNRDYRFYANILYDGCTFKDHVMDIHYTRVNGEEVPGEDLKPYGSSTSATVTRTGYYLGKFVRESQKIDNDENYASSQNCIIWRYAEVLLDYAEIYFKQNRPDLAMEELNKIRRRVHMPEYESITWDDIMNERRVELAFEKSTYWDLLRWGTAEKVMTGTTNPLKGIKIYKEEGKPTEYKEVIVNGRNTVVRYFREMQYFLPIPWDEIRYHGIEQNPTWREM